MENKFLTDFKAKLFADLESLIALSLGVFKEDTVEHVQALLSKYA